MTDKFRWDTCSCIILLEKLTERFRLPFFLCKNVTAVYNRLYFLEDMSLCIASPKFKKKISEIYQKVSEMFSERAYFHGNWQKTLYAVHYREYVTAVNLYFLSVAYSCTFSLNNYIVAENFRKSFLMVVVNVCDSREV